jgi:hypothetical protein
MVIGAVAVVLLATNVGMAKADTTTTPATPAEVAFADQVAQHGWAYGWTHGVDKVFRDRPFAGHLGGTLQVELAANEYAGVQLVLRSRQARTNVRVAVSDLVTQGGGRIAAPQIEVLLVGYVNTKQPPYAVDHVGWWPDPLLNFLPAFDLEADVWQPVWLDVHTAPDQPAGTYKGVVTVTADGTAPLKAPMEVTVWKFALPRTYHFPLALRCFDDNFQQLYSKDKAEWAKYLAYARDQATLESLGTGEARRLADIRRKCDDLVLAHHLIPDNIARGDYPPRIADVKYWKDHGARWFNIIEIPGWFTGGMTLKAGDPYPADRKKRILDILADYVPKLEKEGLLDMAYIYGFDEVYPNEFAALKDIFGEIKKRYPKIPLMTTARDPSYGQDTGLDKYVDIWVPQTGTYDQTGPAIAAARKRGRQVWWYICLDPKHPYANWFVEYTAAEPRLLMGFMPWKIGAQGFLYYSLNWWATNQDVKQSDGTVKRVENAPFRDPINRGPLTNSDGKSFGDYNGDGLIFYPGPQGPLPSIRMKCIRDGLEDYEYLWLLQQRYDQARAGTTRMSGDWLKRAQAALAVDAALVGSLTRYTTAGSDILAARRVIAQLLTEAP